MGQRQATYIITEQDDNKSILPIYNQWNYIKIQSKKILRGIKAVLKFDWTWEPLNIAAMVYYTAAGTNTYKDKGKSHTQWVGGRIETELYDKKADCYTGAFQEDNNNGWNIIKFKRGKDDKIRVEMFCVVGSEDEDRAKNTSLKEYFYENEKRDITKLEKLVTWNPALEQEAKDLLRALHVSSLDAKDKKKISLLA